VKRLRRRVSERGEEIGQKKKEQAEKGRKRHQRELRKKRVALQAWGYERNWKETRCRYSERHKESEKTKFETST